MRTITLVALILMAPMLLCAQQEETLSANGMHAGGFGGPFFMTSAVDGHTGGGAGGGGGFVVNGFFLGAFGQGESFGRVSIESRDYYLSLGYGGLWMGYVVPSHKLVHFYSSVKLGWGEAVLSETEGDIFDEHHVAYDDVTFVIHPEAGLEVNVTHWLRIAAAGGYRFANGINDLATYQSDDFDSPSFSLVLRFGGFGYRK